MTLYYDTPLFRPERFMGMRGSLPVAKPLKRHPGGKRADRPKEAVHQKNNRSIWGNGCSVGGADCLTCPLEDCKVTQKELCQRERI